MKERNYDGRNPVRQFKEENWMEFVNILSVTDISQFSERLYFIINDVTTIQFILDEVCTSSDIIDELYFEILESKIIR